MKRLSGFIPTMLILVVIFGILLMSTGCSHFSTQLSTTTSATVTISSSQNEGFAIYLTKGNVPPSQMEALSHVDIVDKPVIGLDDIVSYNSANHEITLTENGMKNITGLQVPTSGKSFLVCVNKSPIYWGAFWTPISSQSFSGVTIEMPLGSQETNTIKIVLAYPAASFYRGEDPRNNPVVINSLRQAGKLITVPDNPLPHSFKGYEIYSWPQDNLWHYTLITGTNRDKTVQEIITGNNTVSGLDVFPNSRDTDPQILCYFFNSHPFHTPIISLYDSRIFFNEPRKWLFSVVLLELLVYDSTQNHLVRGTSKPVTSFSATKY